MSLPDFFHREMLISRCVPRVYKINKREEEHFQQPLHT